MAENRAFLGNYDFIRDSLVELGDRVIIDLRLALLGNVYVNLGDALGVMLVIIVVRRSLQAFI